MLRVRNVTKRFGGLVALAGVNMDLHDGEILGLIGPNGSGKTTLFNVISGAMHPESGTVDLDGHDLTGGPPFKAARAGIARTYQIVRPLAELTVLENTAVGACFGRNNRPLAQAYEVAAQVLSQVGLAEKIDALAVTLNLAEKKRLELARALASEPQVILLDEVLAGLNPTEVEGMLQVIRDARGRGIDVIMVEHVLQAVVGVCDRAVVLESGEVIAEGEPRAVLEDPSVVRAYLGDPKLVEQLKRTV